MHVLALETLDELKEYIGKEIGTSEWLTVTQERISQFAEATEDRQWTHVDRERARRESPYGGTVAHAFLTLSLISHCMREAVRIGSGTLLTINSGLTPVPFPSPVRQAARIR